MPTRTSRCCNWIARESKSCAGRTFTAAACRSGNKGQAVQSRRRVAQTIDYARRHFRLDSQELGVFEREIMYDMDGYRPPLRQGALSMPRQGNTSILKRPGCTISHSTTHTAASSHVMKLSRPLVSQRTALPEFRRLGELARRRRQRSFCSESLTAWLTLQSGIFSDICDSPESTF